MSDNDYFRRRAVEELAAAEWAAPEAKSAHRDLAKRYMTLLNLHAEASTAPGR